MKLQLETTVEDQRIAWLAAAAVSIHILEALLPSLMPGLKPGFANIITICVLCLYGWSTAAWVSLLRVLVGSLLLGTFLSPTFMLSLSGALASLLILWPMTRLPGRGFGPLGYSVAAALAHITGQFVLAWVWFIPHAGIWKLFPVLLSFAVLLGLVNGIITHKVVKHLHG
ncbi:Gx transporter family protein [Thiohalophilus sp.]|uniref:Gx transporter family protein n=1 Tax=Thiohalophilus sp. TaxID=3028392 RepID=UPI003975EF0F